MDETLRQLGELLLGSVPTVILLALLYALYTTIVHKPLQRVLAERRSKTEGAVEKSRADIAAAEARTAEYEQKLREARAAVFRAQEARRQAVLQARANALTEARSKAQAQVQAAKKDIENDRAAAEAALPVRRGSIGARNRKARAAAGRSRTMMTSKKTTGRIVRTTLLALLLLGCVSVVALRAQEQPTSPEQKQATERFRGTTRGPWPATGAREQRSRRRRKR